MLLVTELRSIRRWIGFFIAGLVISGLTAFPIEGLLRLGLDVLAEIPGQTLLSDWLGKVYEGVRRTNETFPFVAYGTDWLAFAHLVIAVAFVGPMRDPARNIWVIEFGLIACAGIFPLALIAGTVRQIPFYWQCIDCSFGLFGGLVLLVIHRKIKRYAILVNQFPHNVMTRSLLPPESRCSHR